MSGSEARADGLRQAMEKMVTSLDKAHLRPLQKECYTAMATCCDTAPGPAELQRCCAQAERKVQVAEQAVQVAMRDFQERLGRCVQRCQDKAQELLPASPSEKDIAKAQGKLAACAADCAQEYERQIPKLQASLIDRLKQIK